MVRHSELDRQSVNRRHCECNLANEAREPINPVDVVHGFWLLNMIAIWREWESILFLQGCGALFLLVMPLILLAL